MNAKVNCVSITASEYLSNELAEKIANAQWHLPEWSNRIIHLLFDGKIQSDCFNVVAKDESDRLVGRLFCLKNKTDKALWYYGDLFVIPEYRGRHIAERMLKTAEDILAEKGCCTLCTYVEPDNIPSINLQRKIGFAQVPYKSFNNLLNDGELMFEKTLKPYSVAVVNSDVDARYVTMIFDENAVALHSPLIMFDEWKEIFAANDNDEKHFLICKGALPCAYLKLNGLCSKDKTGWISMLAVHPVFQRQGIGEFAVNFAEEYLQGIGKSEFLVQTTEDNIAAQKLYEKCGYELSHTHDVTMGNGDKMLNLVYHKSIIRIK